MPNEMLKRLLPAALAEKVLGPLRTTAADLASTAVDPEVGHIEAMRFQTVIEPDGTFEPFDTDTVLPGHTFALRGIGAFMENPDPFGPALISFQVEEDGRRSNVFRTQQNFSQYMTPAGPNHIIQWDLSIYRFRVGATISVPLTVDEDAWAQRVAARKIIGLTLFGAIQKE